VIIVNFNTEDVLKKCLLSIFKFTRGIKFEVIVVDNSSSDSSVEMLKENFQRVGVIENKNNLGFGVGNNQGAKIASGKYLCFFNPDVVLTENSLGKLLEKLGKNPEIGVCGPKILNSEKAIQQSVGFFPNLPQVFWWMTFIDDLPFGKFLKPYHIDHDSFYQKEQEVDWVTGAAMIISKRIFNGVGGFDENIFLYGEEVELCYRVKKAGFKVFYLPDTKVIHIGQASTKGNIAAITGEYKAVLYFYKKYKNIFARLIACLLLELGALTRILIFGFFKGNSKLLKAYWAAFCHPAKLTLAS